MNGYSHHVSGFLPTVKRPKAGSPRSLNAACHASGCSCLTPIFRRLTAKLGLHYVAYCSFS